MPQVDLSDLEPVDYNPFANPAGPLANYAPPSPPQDMTAAARAGQLGTLSADNPSWGNRLAGAFSNSMGALGATPTGQKNAYEFGQNLTSVIPGVNNAVSANQAYRDWNQGNYGGAALNAVGAVIPPIPGASSAEKAGVRTLEDIVKSGVEPIGGRAIMPEGTPGLLAYHGSRHDFPSFDISQVGQGEGAQVFGHGLYFAEHPEVAENYRTAGADEGKLIDPSGNIMPTPERDYSDPVSEAHSFAQIGRSFKGAHDSVDLSYGLTERDAQGNPIPDKFAQRVHDQLTDWENSGHTIQGPEGYKYQVGINHDPDTFFDLDADFGDQHPNVQKAANQIMGRKFPKDTEGNDVYDSLVEALDDSTATRPASDVSDPHVALAQELNRRGIPGIRYLDEGSRDFPEYPFDWNLRLSDHPQSVQDAVMKLVPDANPSDDMNIVHDKLHGQLFDEAAGGKDARDEFDQDLDPDAMALHREASRKLLAAGVPEHITPITRNYITFSDNNINILKKWGAGGALIGGTMAGGGAADAHDFYRNHPDLERYSLTDASDGGQ